MKKLLNSIDRVVDDMLDGIVASNAELALIEGERVVVRKDFAEVKSAGKVTLISGGGSGHEPAHAGYVGCGMLTAAVCGDVFTSPSTDAVLAAIRTVAGPAGVLLIVKNYTGDRLNFGLAAEIARSEGFDVQMVIVGDDVALSDVAETAGRRGLAGTILVHKAAGAVAEMGGSLRDVLAAAKKVADNLATMGAALSSCTVPAAGRPNFELGENEVEFGLGIHGEQGVRRETLATAGETVARLFAPICRHLQLKPGSRVAIMVNNLGSSPGMELAIVAKEAMNQALAHGLSVERFWSGTFLTAIEMAGCSISVLAVDDAMLFALDAETSARSWPGSGLVETGSRVVSIHRQKEQDSPAVAGSGDAKLADAVRRICEALIAGEAELTALDQKVGDGDIGLNLARGAEAILNRMDRHLGSTAEQALRAVSVTVRRTVGGTSGALLAVGLLRAAEDLNRKQSVDGAAWASAMEAAARGIAEVGDAKVGDRTMLDALLPATAAFNEALGEGASADAAWELAKVAAAEGSASTAQMRSRRGRSSYLGDRTLGIRDPGAEAIYLMMQAVR